MEKAHIAVILVLAVMMVGYLPAPTHPNATSGSLSPISSPATGHVSAPTASLVRSAAPTPAITFPRTVIVETFTAVWCIHCPAESAALYNLDHSTSRGVLDIAELHQCAFPAGSGPCLETYVPADGTSTTRGAFYNVCGYPDVFFDGAHSQCGAGNSIPGTQYGYQQDINNASGIPGNVSISQSASLTAGGVQDQAFINSGITGSYNVVTYLMEYIGKLNVTNGYGPHDLGWVVRETVYNHPASLVAGSLTEINETGALNLSWDQQNLSVVTFVQENSTKIVENANMSLVSTLAAAVTGTPTSVPSGSSVAITVHVANSSTSVALAGAAVSLDSSAGGSFNPMSGATASDGSFTSTFTAPHVTSAVNIVVTAEVTMAGYVGGSGTTLVAVTPVVAPSAPLALTISGGVLHVSLNWSAPASGGGGVTYHVYRSASQSGTFSVLGNSTVTTFVDAGVAVGHSYWYKVNAANVGGFSANTSAIAASSVTGATLGLPPTQGWWVSIDSMVLHSTTNASLSLYLPDGSYDYQYGASSYTYVAPSPSSTLLVAGAPALFTASFTPRYAVLQGTIHPAGATATLDGAPLTLISGTFLEELVAGIYTLHVTTPGYYDNSTTVQLTPGNTTTLNVNLHAIPSTSGVSTSSGGLTPMEMGAIIAIAAAVVVVAAVVGLMMMRKRKGGRASPTSPPESPP